MVHCRLSIWSHWTWNWKEMCTIASCELARASLCILLGVFKHTWMTYNFRPPSSGITVPLSKCNAIPHSVLSNSLQPHQALLSMEFSSKNTGAGSQPFPSPGDLPNPGVELQFPALWADSLPSGPSGMVWVHIRKGLVSQRKHWL